MDIRHRRYGATTAMVLLFSVAATSVLAQNVLQERQAETEPTSPDAEGGTILLDEVVVLSAQEQLRQAPGVSIITADDIQRQPPVNDLSDIIRRMPGVNLTGNTPNGQRGNNRQIDIRGMGPENTLILIDGKPVFSRNSVRMRRGGERDTRGDSNWVPAEAVERIEVLRGPAAARYGSGASGGVVNIITKRPEKLTGSMTSYTNIPESGMEGKTFRSTALLGGPINDKFSFRAYANYNHTDADSPFLNASATPDGENVAAGREGVVNTDLRGLLSWKLDEKHVIDFEAAWSQQRNIYAGDSLFQNTLDGGLNQELASGGAETNRQTRTTLSATHRGDWGFGTSNTYIQWENTKNKRLGEGNAGSGEGKIDSRYASDRKTITLDNLTAKSEWNIPATIVVPQTITLGTEFRGEWMNDKTIGDGNALDNATNFGVASAANRNPKSQSLQLGIYAENNIMVTDKFIVTPGLRFDHHSSSGNNWSPSLNASYALTNEITLKAGIARAFKAPNLFQLNPNYLYTSAGNGCPPGIGPCWVLGNPDLKAETSVNKEIGINYTDDKGWNAGITYFHNDYKNRIAAGTTTLGTFNNWNARLGRYATNNIFRWENTPEAVISGLEGNLTVPLHETLNWSTNGTYMIESKDKSNGQPLSLVPKYTINSSLEWTPLDGLAVTLGVTHYGEIEAPTINQGTLQAAANTNSRSPYTLVNLGARYDINDNFRVQVGVNNLFDKSIKREGTGNAAGANTYNEPGRAYYLSLTGSF